MLADVWLLLTDMVSMDCTGFFWDAEYTFLDKIDNHAELKRLLACIDAPLRRMNDDLKNIHDDLQGGYFTKPVK